MSNKLRSEGIVCEFENADGLEVAEGEFRQWRRMEW